MSLTTTADALIATADALTTTQTAEQTADQQALAVIDALCKGDYSIPIEGTTPLGNALQRLSQALRLQSVDSLDSVVKLSMCSNETSIASAKLLYNLKNVDDRAQSVSSAAEEMRVTAEQIKGYSDQIRTENHTSFTMVEEVMQSSKASVAAFEKINESVTLNSAKVAELSIFARSVRDIADEIKGIAFQTNLLALNASVEAARAGAVGAGFGVVAQEMRHLSTRSTDATKRITDLADVFEQQMANVSLALKSSVGNVLEGKEAIAQVEARMSAMRTTISSVTNSIEHISDSIKEQTAASVEVADGIFSISQETSASVNSTDQIVDSMGDLQTLINGQINKLAELNLPNKIIKLAQSDHVIWKCRLVNMISGKQGLQEKELADHNSCRLGKWYNAVKNSAVGNQREFHDLLIPHEKVHLHGKRAVALYNRHDVGGALQEIEVVEEASKDVLRLLKAMEQYH